MGKVTGELMKSKNLGLVEHIDTFSTSFMHSTETEAAVRAMLLAEKNRPKPMAVEDAPDPLVYEVDAAADPEAEARWQLERERKRALQDAKTAKNRKKRQKKKGTLAARAREEAGAAGCQDRQEPKEEAEEKGHAGGRGRAGWHVGAVDWPSTAAPGDGGGDASSERRRGGDRTTDAALDASAGSGDGGGDASSERRRGE